MFKQKATYATIGGAALGASLGKDPVTAAVYGTIGLVIGYVIGDTIDKGGLVNSSALLKLHNGAIWQSYVQQQEIKEKIDNLEKDLLQQIVSKLEDLETENKKLKRKLEAIGE